jgi:hypothetical protein
METFIKDVGTQFAYHLSTAFSLRHSRFVSKHAITFLNYQKEDNNDHKGKKKRKPFLV